MKDEDITWDKPVFAPDAKLEPLQQFDRKKFEAAKPSFDPDGYLAGKGVYL